MKRVSALLSTLLALALLAASVGCSRKPDDARIAREIQTRFSQDSGLSTRQLTVDSSNGVVTLAGAVENNAQRDAALRQASSVEGVTQVVNRLQVEGETTAAAIVQNASSAPSKPARPKPSASLAHAGEGNPSHSRATTTPSSKEGFYEAGDNLTAQTSQPTAPDPQETPQAEASPSSAMSTPTPSAPPPSPAQPQNVTIEQGTSISIRLIDSIDSEKNQIGDIFHATLNSALSAEGTTIPAGTDVAGHVADLKSAGKFAGQAMVALQLDTIAVNGTKYDLQTDQYRQDGSSQGKKTAKKVGGGALIGGIVGAIAGGGKGAAIGSAAGAGVGAGAQAAGKKQAIKLPSETILSFTLQARLTVNKAPEQTPDRPKLGDAQ